MTKYSALPLRSKTAWIHDVLCHEVKFLGKAEFGSQAHRNDQLELLQKLPAAIKKAFTKKRCLVLHNKSKRRGYIVWKDDKVSRKHRFRLLGKLMPTSKVNKTAEKPAASTKRAQSAPKGGRKGVAVGKHFRTTTNLSATSHPDLPKTEGVCKRTGKCVTFQKKRGGRRYAYAAFPAAGYSKTADQVTIAALDDPSTEQKREWTQKQKAKIAAAYERKASDKKTAPKKRKASGKKTAPKKRKASAKKTASKKRKSSTKKTASKKRAPRRY
jgi:hypothetical protein